jgi:hypothetical protein
LPQSAVACGAESGRLAHGLQTSHLPRTSGLRIRRQSLRPRYPSNLAQLQCFCSLICATSTAMPESHQMIDTVCVAVSSCISAHCRHPISRATNPLCTSLQRIDCFQMSTTIDDDIADRPPRQMGIFKVSHLSHFSPSQQWSGPTKTLVCFSSSPELLSSGCNAPQIKARAWLEYLPVVCFCH